MMFCVKHLKIEPLTWICRLGRIETWYGEACRAEWKSPAEVKAQYGNASIVGNNRIVFNISGNKYRLIVAFAYRMQIA
jgi:mRNA interferase HigB